MNTVDAHIESVPGRLKPIVIKLRESIVDTSEAFTEEMKWNVPTYSINKGVCAIMAHKDHVNLQIFRGADLKDAKILDGTGKKMRHLRYDSLTDVDVSIVKKILKQAISVDRT